MFQRRLYCTSPRMCLVSNLSEFTSLSEFFYVISKNGRNIRFHYLSSTKTRHFQQILVVLSQYFPCRVFESGFWGKTMFYRFYSAEFSTLSYRETIFCVAVVCFQITISYYKLMNHLITQLTFHSSTNVYKDVSRLNPHL